jgi:hypothetical protein
MLNSLISAVTNHDLRYPPIKGLQRQMASYNRENDKKIPQDIVMMLAELAFLARHAPEESQGNTSGHTPPPRNLRRRTDRWRRR